MAYIPPEWFETPEERVERQRRAALGMRTAPMPDFPGFGTAETAGYGYAPYQEASQRAQARLGLRDRLLAGLAGLSSVQPGMNFGQSFIAALGGSARATWAAKQAAMNYAQRQVEQEIQRQNAETQRMLAEQNAKAKPEKVEPWQRTPEEQAAMIDYKVREAKELASVTPKEPKEPKQEPLVQVVGPSGKPIWVRQSQAVGKPAPSAVGAIPKTTEGERRSSGALDRASSLDRTAANLERNLFKMEDQLKLKLPYAIQPLAQKQYTNARKAFTETVLREFSGAAISKDEYDKYDQIFFAQPGDDKTTLNQKRKTRAGILAQLRSMSGAAARDMGLAGLDSLLGGGAPSGGGGADLIYNPETGELEPAQ